MTGDTLTAAISEISDWFEQYFRDIERLRDDLGEAVASAFARDGLVTIQPDESERAREIAVEFLREHPRSDGAGIIFELAQLDPERARLEWWLRDGDDFQRNEFILNPASERFYDYEKLDWFRGGFHSETRTIAGPYIDHLGVDYYISTLTVPAYVGDRLVGVVGTDVRMDDLERVLIPMLTPLPRGAAVLSRHDQVLVGSSGEFSTGVRVAAVPPGYARVPIPTPGLDLRLLYRE